MRVRSVICSLGRSGYMHRDLMAIKSGAKQDGFVFHGKALSPGFEKIVEPATIVSVMLELEDGQIAFGDCADVILAGVAGRDPAFRGEDHIDYLRGEIAPLLEGKTLPSSAITPRTSISTAAGASYCIRRYATA